MNEVKCDARSLGFILDCIGERKTAYLIGENLFIETKERTIQINIGDIEQMYTQFVHQICN